MYIWDFSRSVGAGRATTRNTRGLTRSTIRLIVPPLPAVSRPSNTMQTLAPVAFTHSCMATSSPCNLANSALYLLPPSFAAAATGSSVFVLLVMSRAPRFRTATYRVSGSGAGGGPLGRDRVLGIDDGDRRHPPSADPFADFDDQRQQQRQPNTLQPLQPGQRHGQQAGLQTGNLGRQDDERDRDQ